ncbi:alpha-E domain-containing protein [Methylogaea oryzae]|uniref:alpha-E domain-containing protein n=1 Tax=Methylogaea oryzae TaxID=1295382 RepID=UPI000A9A1AB4|nr:alpha-E domain-containing protein [Methylogaea oryzae]
MLSRTADHLYWLARYIERAENTARMLDVTHRMSLVPNAAQSEAALWRPPVMIAGDLAAFEGEYGRYNAASVLRYMALDENNPSSIVSNLGRARENARAVRVSMSSEMWENVNALWLELRQRIRQASARAL